MSIPSENILKLVESSISLVGIKLFVIIIIQHQTIPKHQCATKHVTSIKLIVIKRISINHIYLKSDK